MGGDSGLVVWEREREREREILMKKKERHN